jgi:flavorubredoxin
MEFAADEGSTWPFGIGRLDPSALFAGALPRASSGREIRRKEFSMKAVVVYESHWGNTAAVAEAIADGLGSDSRAMSTDKATDQVVADADILVVGAPVIAFGLARDKMRAGLADDRKAPSPADIGHPSMRSWLARLPIGKALGAAFETRVWWSPRGATGEIERSLRNAGYEVRTKAAKFVVEGTYGPLRDGELDRARAWGAQLAASIAVAAA